MSGYGKVKGAHQNAGGKNFGIGRHVVRILAAKEETSKDPKKAGAKLFIVPVEIVESTCHETGEKLAWVQNMSQVPAMGNLNNFMFSVGPWVGYTTSQLNEFTEEQIDVLFNKWLGPENPLLGALVRLETVIIKTQKGNDFTKFIWSAYSKDSAPLVRSTAPTPAATVPMPQAAPTPAATVPMPAGPRGVA